MSMWGTNGEKTISNMRGLLIEVKDKSKQTSLSESSFEHAKEIMKM